MQPIAMCTSATYSTRQVQTVRTNIVIDDALMKEAMRASGAKTKRAAVEAALRVMVGLKRQERLIRSARGKLRWEGDLDAMRRDRLETK